MIYPGWGGWGWMMLMPLLWVILVAVIVSSAVVLTRRSTDKTSDQSRRETPQEIVDRRFATGEIDADRYTRTRDQLAGERRSS